jgi:hypothetical protein
MLAGNFFHADCAVILQRISVFVALEVPSRSVPLLGTTTSPEGRGTTQQIRTLVMDLGDHITQFGSSSATEQASSPHHSTLSWPRWASTGSGFLRGAPGRTVSPNGSCAPSGSNSPTAC